MGNNKGVLMKKLMMFATAMTIVGGAYASSCAPNETVAACDVPVWDLSVSGKTANETVKGYKAVSSFKMKGALIGVMQEAGIFTTVTTNFPGTPTQAVIRVSTTNLECCLDSFNAYVYGKTDGAAKLYKIDTTGIEKMSVFGKNFAKVQPDQATKMAGKSVSLESDVMWTVEDGVADGVTYNLQFVGFGKATFKWSKVVSGVASNSCAPGVAASCPEVTPAWPSWSGWVTGTSDGCDDYYSMICNESVDDVIGGTWSAKLNKKLSSYDTVEAAETALEAKFKATIDDGTL